MGHWHVKSNGKKVWMSDIQAESEKDGFYRSRNLSSPLVKNRDKKKRVDKSFYHRGWR